MSVKASIADGAAGLILPGILGRSSGATPSGASDGLRRGMIPFHNEALTSSLRWSAALVSSCFAPSKSAYIQSLHQT